MISDERREAEWKAGYHTDSDGMRHKLDDMNYEHLQHTIKAFSHLDSRSIKVALRKKQKNFIPVVIDYLTRQEKLPANKTISKKKKKSTRLAKAARIALEAFVDR
jgi:hypothetical protein